MSMSEQNEFSQDFTNLFTGMELLLPEMPDLYDESFLRLDTPNEIIRESTQVAVNVLPMSSQRSSSVDIRSHLITFESTPEVAFVNEPIQLPSLKTHLSPEKLPVASSPHHIVSAIVINDPQVPHKATEWSTFSDEQQQQRLEQQNHIVKSMSVAQLKAVAAAYSHVRWNDDFTLGCDIWMHRNPMATVAEIRAVKALLNPERWEHTQEIVASISLLVRQLHDEENTITNHRKNQHVIVQRKRTRKLSSQIDIDDKIEGKRMRDSE